MKSLLFIVLLKLTTTYGSYIRVNVSCRETVKFADHSGWPKENPSVLMNLSVSLADRNEEHSEFALNISWAISVDYSNKYLIGTEFIVNDKSFLCHYHPPLNEVNLSGYEQWFHYTEIPAIPGTPYRVTGYNLPTPVFGDDEARRFKLFHTPDCSNEAMREHGTCLHIAKIESEWEPNIASIFVNGQVEVSFTSSNSSTKYDLEIWRCASPRKCTNSGEYISHHEANTQVGKSRWTRTLNATGPCDSLYILIWPHFSHCDMFCHKKIAAVDCSQKEPPTHTVLLCLVGITMVLLPVAVLMWCNAHKAHSEFSELPRAAELVSVLVVYPAGNRAFQRAVLAFAEFLRSQWRCEVAIDVWQSRRMAEQGPVRWLTAQTERADKVAVVCAQRPATGESVTQHRQPEALRDLAVPASAGDVFSLALNAMEGQMQAPSALTKYCAVHLGDRTDVKHLPAALRACKSFSLMRDVEKLGRHLHNADPEACCLPSGELKPGALNGDVGRRLRDAICELQTGGQLPSH